MSTQPPGRRTVLCGTALAGAAGIGLTACSGPGSGDRRSPAVPTAPLDLGAADAVPVGASRLYRDQKLVVSQSEEGRFKAFSAVCTHAGCVLTSVDELEADCTCHGSRFDTTSGEVLAGPANEPLPEVPIRVAGGRLVAGPGS
ncbi:Rieske 2Fe-2S domain-containing protein [Streptomyces sp. TRM43335]|uniref:Cytochrome bc1 complex Rieske iron-sulfur subunit n=1 Tax=Streptomyces taklimakanensis TaxID=2569853 RepID=A0A6G2B8G5_9ACTN|nr:Rieske (2Fe-2S) protein [Streptomyces taklimakanensis]MTE18550.1 Rieske 2Fe-2S domain-containing protein [Streptomyces taklimakanensis]